jgi:hypothetical protein
MNNRGKHIYKAYLTGEIALNNAKSKLESTMSDKWLTEEDKRNRRGVILSEVEKAVNGARGEVVTRGIEDYAEASGKFKRRLRGNEKTVSERASIMGAQYSQMSDDELVRSLDAKFTDEAERGLILRYLDTRVEAQEPPKPTEHLAPVENPLKGKIDRVIVKNADRLEGVDASYLQDLREAKEANDFAVNASTALELELKDLKGELQVTSLDLIKRRDAVNAVKKYVGSGFVLFSE